MFIISKDLRFEDYQTPNPDDLLMPPSAFLGKRLDEVLGPEVGKLVEGAALGTLEDGRHRTVRYSLDLGQGRQWFEATSGRCADGSILFVVRNRTPEVLSEERLRMTDRMASLGALASGIAHEINNPLTYVFGNIEYIRNELQPIEDEDLRVAFADVAHGLERVRELVSDLRVFSHPGGIGLTAVNLEEVIESTLRIARGKLDRQAKLIHRPSELPAIAGNESQIGQVVLHLVSNALDALEHGTSGEDELRIETRVEGDFVVLTVSDTGMGLPAALGERIFDPFVTSKPVGRGTGMGLSICRSIVESLGGTIRAENRAPRGAVLTVRFPKYRSGAAIPATPEQRPDSDPMRSARVLIVDDDERVARLAAKALGTHLVTVALDGRTALEALSGPGTFDLVLCDLMMPDMTGMDLFRLVQGDRPELTDRFIFMAGSAFRDDARSFLEANARPLLQKPFDAATLQDAVRRALDIADE